MNNNLITGILAAIRYCVSGVRDRSLLKHLAFATCVTLIGALFMAQQIPAQAADLPDTNSSAEQVISKIKERLHLTEEQETKMRPIIEENVQTRRGILKRDAQDRSAIRNELQELQLKTDMRLGVILTGEQMKEYEKLREEQSEKMPRSDVQGNRGSRGGRSRGF